jgi:hypothetical protein
MNTDSLNEDDLLATAELLHMAEVWIKTQTPADAKAVDGSTTCRRTSGSGTALAGHSFAQWAGT